MLGTLEKVAAKLDIKIDLEHIFIHPVDVVTLSKRGSVNYNFRQWRQRYNIMVTRIFHDATEPAEAEFT